MVGEERVEVLEKEGGEGEVWTSGVVGLREGWGMWGREMGGSGELGRGDLSGNSHRLCMWSEVERKNLLTLWVRSLSQNRTRRIHSMHGSGASDSHWTLFSPEFDSTPSHQPRASRC